MGDPGRICPGLLAGVAEKFRKSVLGFGFEIFCDSIAGTLSFLRGWGQGGNNVVALLS